MYVEPITANHNRESFTCGEQEVDDFLRYEALKEDYGNTWVVVSERNLPEIIAFYTIDPDPIVGVMDNEYGEHPVGLVRLQMLGVAVDYQRQGIGEKLLMRMIKQVLLVANRHSIDGILLTALNQKAKDWYLRRNLGFREAAPGSMHLLLPTATMRMLPGVDNLMLSAEGF